MLVAGLRSRLRIEVAPRLGRDCAMSVANDGNGFPAPPTPPLGPGKDKRGMVA